METYTCKFCGQTFDAEHIFEFDETMMCEDCYDEHTAICSICEERIHSCYRRYKENSN